MSLFTSIKPSIFPETPRKWNPLKSWSNDIIAWTHFQIVLQVPVFGPRFAPYFNVTDVSVADNSHLVQCAILCLLDLLSLYLCNSKTIWAKCCPCCPIVIVVSNLLSGSCQFSLICLMSVFFFFLWILFLVPKKISAWLYSIWVTYYQTCPQRSLDSSLCTRELTPPSLI